MTDNIKLPPLPKGDIAADTCPVMWVHSNEQLQAYAREAIEADRKRRGEPVAWQFYDDGRWWNGDDRIKDHRKNTENAGYKTRDLYAHPQPAEPVKVPSDVQADAQIAQLLEEIERLERFAEALTERVRELEALLAAIGAGGVEPLRGSHQARECREALAACIKLLKKTPKITQNIYVGKDRQSWGAQAKIVLEAALAAQAKKVEQQ